MRVVELDEACRRQQVNDGCFPSLDEVPRTALSLTDSVPAPGAAGDRHRARSAPSAPRSRPRSRARSRRPARRRSCAAIATRRCSSTRTRPPASAERAGRERKTHDPSRPVCLFALHRAARRARPDAQDVRIVRPVETDEVLVNPGMGFMTFQRFNGDALNEGSGWTEGRPIVYQEWNGDLTNVDHPADLPRLLPGQLALRGAGAAPVRLGDDRPRARHRGEPRTDAASSASLRTRADDMDVPDWYRRLVGPERSLATRSGGPTRRTRATSSTSAASSAGSAPATTGTRTSRRSTCRSSATGERAPAATCCATRRARPSLNAYLDGFRRTRLLLPAPERRRAGPGLPGRAACPIAASWPDGRTTATRPADASPGLALRLPGRPGLLEGPGPRLGAHVRRVSPADHRERDVRRLAPGSGVARDLRHVPGAGATSRATARRRSATSSTRRSSGTSRRSTPRARRCRPSGSRWSTTG